MGVSRGAACCEECDEKLKQTQVRDAGRVEPQGWARRKDRLGQGWKMGIACGGATDKLLLLGLACPDRLGLPQTQRQRQRQRKSCSWPWPGWTEQ